MDVKVVASSNGKHDKTHVVASSTDRRGYTEVTVGGNAWDLVQSIADELPPYLEDDDLTAERFYQRNIGKMSKKEALTILERLVESGNLERQERRRKGKSGGHSIIYVATK